MVLKYSIGLGSQTFCNFRAWFSNVPKISKIWNRHQTLAINEDTSIGIKSKLSSRPSSGSRPGLNGRPGSGNRLRPENRTEEIEVKETFPQSLAFTVDDELLGNLEFLNLPFIIRFTCLIHNSTY